MKFTPQESRTLHRLLKNTADAPVAQKMRRFTQHGTISTYRHCADVTRMCFWLNRRLHLGADEKALVRGAFLHDLYLYDWHDKDPSHKWHGFHHADKALENASRHFQLSPKEKQMIYCHMWPLNLTRVPKSREALILCISDKLCALRETILCRRKNTRKKIKKSRPSGGIAHKITQPPSVQRGWGLLLVVLSI